MKVLRTIVQTFSHCIMRERQVADSFLSCRQSSTQIEKTTKDTSRSQVGQGQEKHHTKFIEQNYTMASLPPALDFPKTEEEICAKWAEENTFKKQDELALERGDEVRYLSSMLHICVFVVFCLVCRAAKALFRLKHRPVILARCSEQKLECAPQTLNTNNHAH